MASGRGVRASCSFPVPAHAHLDSCGSGPTLRDPADADRGQPVESFSTRPGTRALFYTERADSGGFGLRAGSWGWCLGGRLRRQRWPGE